MRSKIPAVVFACFSSGAMAAASTPTQSVMQSIFAPMSRLLVYGVDDQAFAAPANKSAIHAEIRQLSANVGHLAEHGKTQDRAFEYVARSLARDVGRLERWFATGRHDEAAFVLRHMTENCIACHANLPESRQFPAAERFFAQVNVKKLHPLDRARLQVMSRQFDAAMDSYEAYFRTKETDPALVTLLGSFADYLKLSISVKSDFKRPQATIGYFADRPTTPLHIKQQLQKWQQALREFEAKSPLQAANVAAARRLLTEGRGLMEFSRDRDGLIHYLTAEAMLTRLVRGGPDRGRDVGESYYLLGIAASMTEHSIWVNRSDFYLESAIRLAPSAPFAPKAYARLEESMTVNNSGSGGTHIPPEERQLLLELKRIVEQEHGKI